MVFSSSLEPIWIVLGAVACGAAVGWGTNAMAVWMLFKPERFVGYPPWLGWQGVIPRRSVSIARACLDASLDHLHGLEKVVRDLDPDLLARHIVSVLDERVEELVDDVMDEHHPVLWENLPRRIQEQVYAWVRRELPRRVNRLVDDIAHHADDLVDFYELLEKEFGEHPERMAELFRCAGQHTFERLIAWGGLWGALLGLIQASIHAFWPSGWIWIAGAAVNGWVTNWLALTLNFRPLEPVKVFGVTLQGDFLRRQPEVAERWANYVAHHVLTLDTVARYMVHGRYGDRTRAIIARHVKPILDEAGVIRWTMQVAVGTSGYVELKEAVRHRAIELAEEPFRDRPFREATAQRIAERLCRLLRALPPASFQRILLPAFQSEQWLLMLAGGLAGAVAGGVQAWII